jgi:hypothetical protein
MRIWSGYGSEHSMNLVMIGTFKEASDAEQAKQLIDDLVEKVRREPNIYDEKRSPLESRFSDDILTILRRSKLSTIGPAELEQFAYDVDVQRNGKTVVLKTDEIEVSAFMKLLIERGARVEVYSTHDYPEAKQV